MDAIYHLKPGELTDDFLKAMKLLYQHQRVKVTVEVEEDETESIRANSELHEKLMRRLGHVNAGKIRPVDLDNLNGDASVNV